MKCFFDGAEDHVHKQYLEAPLQGSANDGLVLLGAEDGLDDERPIRVRDQIPDSAFAFVGRSDVRLFQGKLRSGPLNLARDEVGIDDLYLRPAPRVTPARLRGPAQR